MHKEGIIHLQILIAPFLHTEKGVKRDDIELAYKQLFTYNQMFGGNYPEDLFLLEWKEIGHKLFVKMLETYKHDSLKELKK